MSVLLLCPHVTEGKRELSEVSFITALILFMRAPWLDHLVTEPNLGLLPSLTAKPIYCLQVVVKESTTFTEGHQARRTGSSCSKDPDSLMAFREGFLKATFEVRFAGCVIFSWLVGGKVTRWYFGNLNHQPLVPTRLWSTCLWSACSHPPPPGEGS